MTNDRILPDALKRVHLYDYYYSYYAGYPGWEFSYKDKDGVIFLFTVYISYFDKILDFISFCNVKNECNILEKYLDGGGGIIDESLLGDAWVVEDKDNFIDNLCCINEKKSDYFLPLIKEKKLTDDDIELTFEILESLIVYLKNSQDYQVSIQYM